MRLDWLRCAATGQMVPALVAAAMVTASDVMLRAGADFGYFGYAASLVLMAFAYMIFAGLASGAGASLLGREAAPAFAQGFVVLRWRMLLLGICSVAGRLLQAVVSANVSVLISNETMAMLASYLPQLLLAPLFALFLPIMAIGFGKLLRPLGKSIAMGFRHYLPLAPAVLFVALEIAIPSLMDASYLQLAGARYADLPWAHPMQLVTIVLLAYVFYFRSLWSMHMLYRFVP